METGYFLIRGGKPLKGEIDVRGSKNAASKIMIATLLTEEPCVIENVPRSLEIDITVELCQGIGSAIAWEGEHQCRIRTAEVFTSRVPELSRKNRVPILAIGPLLHRRGMAEVPVLGGCPIGHRPINFHLEALNQMGVRIERRVSSYYAEADRIRGADIELPYPSVGATENIILTAVLAQGRTRISNAAVEPEIENLIQMLSLMGAEIIFREIARSIEIQGVGRLKGARIRVMPDRNEIVSFAAAALATEGDVILKGAEGPYLESFLAGIREAGASCEILPRAIRFFGKKPYRALRRETSPHPGFMTDWQQPFCVLLTQSDGDSIIHETVYEDRFGYVKDLLRMGADIAVSDECGPFPACRFSGRTFNHRALIRGPRRLAGTEIMMTDIRAGMAHIIAALAAEGESIIRGISHIDRGYERIDERLFSLGADIVRCRQEQ
jgi:UDP-N-acetylglucosamine 1-carboxyvinyltransferase